MNNCKLKKKSINRAYILFILIFISCSSPKKMEKSGNKNDFIINIEQFGAKADGKTDDSKAFQSAINYAKKTGIRLLHVPPGRYYFESTVFIDIEGIKIYSESGLSYQRQPSWYITGKKGLRTLFSILDSQDNNMSFEMAGMNFYSKDIKSGPISVIEVNTAYDKPPRAFTLSKCSFSGFESCIHFNSATKDNRYTWGFVNIYDNVFIGNTYSVLATSGILSLRFERNESEQGGRIKGHIWGNIWIVNNNLEGQSNPIDISAPGTGYVYLAHNYYESNMSTDAINKFSFGGGDSQVKVGPNFNMFETNNFISVSGAKLIYEGEGDIGKSFVFPDLQKTLSFFSRVSAGNAFSIPVLNVAVGKYPIFAAILEDKNVQIVRTNHRIGLSKSLRNGNHYELRYNKDEISSVFTYPDFKIKAGEIIKILIPYEYRDANPKESFYLEVRDFQGGKTNLSGGYLSDINKFQKDKRLVFYSIISPYNLDGLELHIYPFASQSKEHLNAQFIFENPQISLQNSDETIKPTISK